MSDFLKECRASIGSANVLTDTQDVAPYVTDWRRRSTGKALAVLRPTNTEEVSKIIQLAQQFRIPIVPQGGNTGLVLGSIPDESGTAAVLSLQRLNRVRDIDTANNTITVEAGCVLATVQQAAVQADRLFPLSLASEGSCTVGGNLSTNAGGTAVLRYGNARELCIGLEVVTANGDIWNGLRGLRKDNTGYDLRDLYIGAEGTLGIITAAVLKLFPRPASQLTALAAVQSPNDAIKLLNLAQQHGGASVTAFELISDLCVQLVRKHFPSISAPFQLQHPYYVLLEISDNESEQHATQLLEFILNQALEQGILQDASIATSLAQSQSMWNLREHISAAQAAEGKNIKHDISLPISQIADFVGVTESLLQQQIAGIRVVCFGHLGDGNLHYNVSPPIGEDAEQFLQHQTMINRIVHDEVHQRNGSISAEHGLGTLKRDEILRYKSPIEMQLMRSIKTALDPNNLMNPGKIL